MTGSVFYIVAVLLLLTATGLFLRRPRPAIPERGAPPSPQSPEFFPVHCRYFPQMRHALSREDSAYLARRASAAVYSRWRKSQRRAGRLYLVALREDFRRLSRLARLLSLYSAEMRARPEVQMAWLNFQFEFLYGMVLARFVLGLPAAGSFGRISAFVGSLGSRLEHAALSLETGPGALSP